MGEADLLQKPLFFGVFSVFGGLNRRFQVEPKNGSQSEQEETESDALWPHLAFL
jgi:hypothetical protein